MRETTESSSNSNFNYTLFYFRTRLNDNSLTYINQTGYGFWKCSRRYLDSDSSQFQSQHDLYEGFDMYKNLNVNGASVPYGLFSHGADPQVGYQGVKFTYMYPRCTGIIAPHIWNSLVRFDNQTRNGFKWSVLVFYEPDTSGTHTGSSIMATISIWKDVNDKHILTPM